MNPIMAVVTLLSAPGVGALDTWYEGKCSYFNVNTRAALYEAAQRDRERVRLPLTAYCACRWNYNALARELGVKGRDACKRELFYGTTVTVVNPLNGRRCVVQPVDWGPAGRLRRMIDLDPATMRYLRAETDQVLKFKVTRNEQ